MTLTETANFDQVFPTLASDVIQIVKELDFPENAVEYLTRMLNHNVPGGKMNRGLSVFHSFQLLNAAYTPEMKFKADILGWCVEWLQAFFLVADDIMDHSKTRRGQPCWYLVGGVGNIAINDSFLLESFIYKLLKKYFRQDAYYVELLELFHEVTFQTELGQLMDLLTAPEEDVDLSRFSSQKYTLIVQYKTAYYSFYLPVALALLMNGTKKEEAFKVANDILIPLGIFFQVQDDYLDCFGNVETIGKIGTDIQDNKCSWLVVQALSLATPEQLAILQENYGQKDEAKVEKVKQLYRELDLPGVFQKYEESSFEHIKKLIDAVDETLVPKQVFLDFASKIYKRQK